MHDDLSVVVSDADTLAWARCRDYGIIKILALILIYISDISKSKNLVGDIADKILTLLSLSGYFHLSTLWHVIGSIHTAFQRRDSCCICRNGPACLLSTQRSQKVELHFWQTQDILNELQQFSRCLVEAVGTRTFYA